MSFQKNDFFPRFFFFSSHKTNGLFSLQATKLKKKKKSLVFLFHNSTSTHVLPYPNGTSVAVCIEMYGQQQDLLKITSLYWQLFLLFLMALKIASHQMVWLQTLLSRNK